MRRVGLVALLALALAAEAAAQPASASRDSVFRRFLAMGTMVKGGQVQANWLADGASFWFVEGGPGKAVIHRVDARTGARSPMFDTGRLRQALAARLGHEPPYAGVPFERFTLVDGEQAARFTVEGRDFRLDRASYVVSELPAPSLIERDRRTPKLVRLAYPSTSADVYEVPSPDGRWFAGLEDHNVWLRSTADGRDEALTSGGSEERPWEVEGAKWSPDGLRLAVTREDFRGVNRVPLIHWLKPVEEVEWRWFTKAGGPLPKVELHVVDAISHRTVPVDLGPDPEPYLSIVGFTPDGGTLLVLANSR